MQNTQTLFGKHNVNPATLLPSPRASFFHSLRVYLQMKTWKTLGEKETELTKRR